MEDVDKDIELASTGNEEELRYLAHHPSHRVIEVLLKNKNLTEDIALIIASRKNMKPEILELLINDMRWKDNYHIMLTICKNPRTPHRISLSIIKFFKIFDLADLTRNQFIPTNIKKRAEAVIIERIPTMPLGIKKALTKRAGSTILMRLIEGGEKDVVALCLDSPFMTEAEIYKILHNKTVHAEVIKQIAEHPKWSYRYQIQRVLIYNAYAPLSRVVYFLKNIKTAELKELYEAPEVPSGTKPFIYSELRERDGNFSF